jgi:UDP-4-amino-4,6-dideoxy-N-acetyl-beta-L-altrosamine N-acetyltransferase
MTYKDSMIVDDHSRHEKNGIRFEKLQEKHLEMVLKWRVQPDVTRYMATDIEYDTGKQKQWFQTISNDESSQYWVITYKAIPVGLIALVDTNWAHRYTNWTYYIGEEKYRLALGSIIPLYFYNYIFNDLKLNKIFASVMAENRGIKRMLQFHGFREVGVYKQHIYKNNCYHDLLMMELLVDHWKTKCDKFGEYVGVFE